MDHGPTQQECFDRRPKRQNPMKVEPDLSKCPERQMKRQRKETEEKEKLLEDLNIAQSWIVQSYEALSEKRKELERVQATCDKLVMKLAEYENTKNGLTETYRLQEFTKAKLKVEKKRQKEKEEGLTQWEGELKIREARLACREAEVEQEFNEYAGEVVASLFN